MKWKAFFIVFEGLWFGAKIKNCWHTAVYGLNVDSFTALPKPATKTVIVGWRWSTKKLIFKILQNSCESTPVDISFKKVACLQLTKNRSRQWCFPVNFEKFFGTTFLSHSSPMFLLLRKFWGTKWKLWSETGQQNTCDCLVLKLEQTKNQDYSQFFSRIFIVNFMGCPN